MSEVKILEHNPLSDSEKILQNDFYGTRTEPQTATSGAPVSTAPVSNAPVSTAPVSSVVTPITITTETEEKISTPRTRKPKAKPTHYKVVCISLYTQDIENLEATVAELKRRGHTKANKSQLIRQALRQLDIDKLPPPQQ